jgi:hypothetical protein
MTISEWILITTILAIVLAPIVALVVGGILQRRSDAHRTKLTLFGTLMAQRHDPFSIEVVRALNLIDAAYAGDSAVREAWTRYYAALSDPNLNEGQGGAIREDKRRDLLLEMVRALGLARKISSADLLRGYMPTFALEAAQLAQLQRKAALEEMNRRANPGGPAAGNGAASPPPA